MRVTDQSVLYYIYGRVQVTPTYSLPTDRFFRKIIWMKLAPSNHNPKVIARFYLECVKNSGGRNYHLHYCMHRPIAMHSIFAQSCRLPSYPFLSCDHGTENVNLATILRAFRLAHDDPLAGTKFFFVWPVYFKYSEIIH